MKITIAGVGAIGGLIGARLAAAGRAQVSALARGATLQALRAHGWRVNGPPAAPGNTPGRAASSAPGTPSVGSPPTLQVPAHAHDQAQALGVQDAVIIAVKGPALAALAPSLAPLIGPHTLIVPAMNGVPWWFCASVPELAGSPLQSLDPQGLLAQCLPLAQVVGCVVHASASCPQPGLVDHRMGQGLILGRAGPVAAMDSASGSASGSAMDSASGSASGSATGPAPDDGSADRLQDLCRLLAHAGFEVTHSPDIRRDIWYKLWGNLTMNPVSALTGATMDRVLGDPLLRDFCSQAMLEAGRIGARIGCPVAQTPEDRHAITQRLGAVKTSMLQDVEAGRPIELDAIVGAVHEIGLRLGEPMPAIGALLGLTRVMAQQRGLIPLTAD